MKPTPLSWRSSAAAKMCTSGWAASKARTPSGAATRHAKRIERAPRRLRPSIAAALDPPVASIALAPLDLGIRELRAFLIQALLMMTEDGPFDGLIEQLDDPRNVVVVDVRNHHEIEGPSYEIRSSEVTIRAFAPTIHQHGRSGGAVRLNGPRGLDQKAVSVGGLVHLDLHDAPPS